MVRQAPSQPIKMASPGPDARLQLNLAAKPTTRAATTETSALQCSPPGSANRDDSLTRAAIGRQASASVTRQLFAQPVGDDPSPISARGLNRHTSDPQVQVAQTLSSTSGMATTTSTGQPMSNLRLVSAAPPRPSPRGHPTGMSGVQPQPVQPWRSHSQGAPIQASPRGAKAIAAMQGIDSRPPVQAPAVRAIVSEIERRSTSQTPGMATRTVEATSVATPHRATAMASSIGTATTRSASATAPTASMRIHSNGPPPVAVAASQCSARGRRQGDENDMMFCGSPQGVEDPHIVFGMSPMGRPRGEKTMHMTTRGMTPSPSPKGPSVQERIRALQTRR